MVDKIRPLYAAKGTHVWPPDDWPPVRDHVV